MSYRLGHHASISTIYILQDLYSTNNKSIRTALKNSHYFAIFGQRRCMSAINTLGHQIFGFGKNGGAFLLSAFEQQKLFQPIVISCHPSTPIQFCCIGNLLDGEPKFLYLMTDDNIAKRGRNNRNSLTSNKRKRIYFEPQLDN